MILSEILRKYPKTNNDWNLVCPYGVLEPLSLGRRISWMYNELMVNCGIDIIPNDVINSINSFDSVTEYFVRQKLIVKDFKGDDVYDKLAPNNVDPWNRDFLVYYGNVIHPEYYSVKNRDGWDKVFISVYFNNMVAKYSAIHTNNDDKVPLMVLYVTTVDKKDVYCLDVIKS